MWFVPKSRSRWRFERHLWISTLYWCNLPKTWGHLHDSNEPSTAILGTDSVDLTQVRPPVPAVRTFVCSLLRFTLSTVRTLVVVPERTTGGSPSYHFSRVHCVHWVDWSAIPAIRNPISMVRMRSFRRSSSPLFCEIVTMLPSAHGALPISATGPSPPASRS